MKHKVHLVPTFHYDIAYLMTFEEYFPRLKHIYTEMLSLMSSLEYSFMFEQALLIRVLCELCPEQRDILRSLISSGRLEVTGFYVQADNNIPCGESLIRNAVLGKKLVEQLGGMTETAWMGDVFGQNAQLPQIIKQCGYDYVQFSRGFRKDRVKSPFLWEALDGTRVISSYGRYAGLPFTPNIEKNLKGMRDLLKMKLEDSVTEDVLLPSGGDWHVPAQSALETVNRWNQENEDVKIIFSSPSRFFAAAKKSSDLPVVRKDMNPVHQGTYTSRIRLKIRNREIENRLVTAEKLSAICSGMGLEYPDEKLGDAWEKVLLNQFHDVLCGSCIDPVFSQAMQWYVESERKADDIIAKALDFLAEKADTRTRGKAILVFNPLGFDRRDLVELRLTISKPRVKGLQVLDENGEEVSVQLADKVYYGGKAPPYLPVTLRDSIAGGKEAEDEETSFAVEEAGLTDRSVETKGLREVTILFSAEIPALGYRVFELQETMEEQKYHSQLEVTRNCVENQFYKVTLNNDGTIRSIVDREGSLEFIDPKHPFANHLLLQIDRGDLYTIMPLLDWRDPPSEYLREQRAKMIRERNVGIREIDTKLWGSKSSKDLDTKVEIIERGPVRATVKVSGDLRFWVGINVHFTQFIRLYNDIKRIDFETHLFPRGKHYRIRVCFPINVENGVIRHEIPFGQIERPEGEYPAQNWIDYADDKKGLCIVNRGLPGNNVAENTAMITLLRSVAFEYKGVSEGAFEEKVPHTFHYSIIPFVKKDSSYQPWNHGNEVNNPLIARVVQKDAGELSRKHSFMKIEPRNVVLSALTRKDEHVLARVYEAAGQKAKCKILTSLAFGSALPVNCLDEETENVETDVSENNVEFDMRPFEIKTIRLF